MKMVTAYVRYEAFEPIRASLLSKGFPSISISEVKGSGRQKGITESYRGAKVTNYLRPKLKIEVGVRDEDCQLVIDTILENASSGEVGDGKIFVTNVEQSIRIRTGEFGEETLQSHPAAADAEA
ncbi:MAG: P-II family nitrogen regulator [Solirubrobacteraceae bacterium]|nr:P-II family nitrogen regulator [Solirubrobacteraceae bacterium]